MMESYCKLSPSVLSAYYSFCFYSDLMATLVFYGYVCTSLNSFGNKVSVLSWGEGCDAL